MNTSLFYSADKPVSVYQERILNTNIRSYYAGQTTIHARRKC